MVWNRNRSPETALSPQTRRKFSTVLLIRILFLIVFQGNCKENGTYKLSDEIQLRVAFWGQKDLLAAVKEVSRLVKADDVWNLAFGLSRPTWTNACNVQLNYFILESRQ